MRNFTIILKVLLFIIPFSGFAQKNTIQGVVYELREGEKLALPLANVFWVDGSEGTVTDNQGKFGIIANGQHMLVASFVGLQSDTIHIHNENEIIEFVLGPGSELAEVDLIQREKATKVELFGAAKVETIGQKELQKAACCNLSESFETNPSIDVSITDAVTGAKQIEMLGLAGPYAQITRENMPDVRGLSAVSGLTYTPGHWVESIQLNKGTGSVINGYESITGQINVCLQQPETMDRMSLNVYGNVGGRKEFNGNFGQKVAEGIHTALLLHASGNDRENDRNGDRFLDMPMGYNLIALNRWKIIKGDWRAQLGVKGTLIDKTSGQTSAVELNPWKAYSTVERLDVWSKIGRINPTKVGRSTGLQLQGSYNKHGMGFGSREYLATQKSFYANLLSQAIIGNTDHIIKYGLSYQYDEVEEQAFGFNQSYIESVPGLYAEYNYCYGEYLDIVLGARADYHNIYGFFVTPRLHARYALTESSVLRFSGGRGARTSNVFAENMGAFASNRSVSFARNPANGSTSSFNYGLGQEQAWNYGLNFTHKFKIDFRDAVIAIDAYRTSFINQVVVDFDQNVKGIMFYNTEDFDFGSYANSVQLQFDYELVNRLDLRLAYRFLDVQNDYISGGRNSRVLQSKHRAFMNLAYETLNAVKFDLTLNWVGKKRLPNTLTSPTEFQLDAFSNDYLMLNAQISKYWEKQDLEIYIGGENLLNIQQDNPILNAENPNAAYFDASMIWGPVFGRNIYAGLRYSLK